MILRIAKKISILILAIMIQIMAFSSVEAKMIKTNQVQQNYIDYNKKHVVAVLDGSAPLYSEDKYGNIEGIAVEVLKLVSERTGLQFELVSSKDEEKAIGLQPDLYLTSSKSYQHNDVIYSVPYLMAETSIYVNKYVEYSEKEELNDKVFAAVVREKIPNDISNDKVKVYENHLAALEAVDRNEADYGVTNEFTMSYYLAKESLKNLVVMPLKGSERNFSFGFLNKDPVLIEIVNQAIESISASEMQSIIITSVSSAMTSNDFSYYVERYKNFIYLGVALGLSVLIYLTITLFNARNKLHMDNIRYEFLAEYSKELLFEYDTSIKLLRFMGKNEFLINNRKDRMAIKEAIKKTIMMEEDGKESILKFDTLSDGVLVISIQHFKAINKYAKASHIFGSISDITEKVKEIEILEYQSRVDGLTKVFNARYTQDMIITRLQSKEALHKDVFILMDINDFKNINDINGHLVGNDALYESALLLKEIFPDAYVLGRVGGDEFAIYLSNVVSGEAVASVIERALKTRKLLDVNSTIITYSFGLTEVTSQRDYNIVFDEADKAMYKAKSQGKNKVVLFKK